MRIAQLAHRERGFAVAALVMLDSVAERSPLRGISTGNPVHCISLQQKRQRANKSVSSLLPSDGTTVSSTVPGERVVLARSQRVVQVQYLVHGPLGVAVPEAPLDAVQAFVQRFATGRIDWGEAQRVLVKHCQAHGLVKPVQDVRGLRTQIAVQRP